MCASYPFEFEGGMWVLIVTVPVHFLFIYFERSEVRTVGIMMRTLYFLNLSDNWLIHSQVKNRVPLNPVFI